MNWDKAGQLVASGEYHHNIGQYIWTYNWEGSNHIKISGKISGNDWKVNDVVQFQDYRIRLIDYHYTSNTWLGVRENWLGIPRLMSHKSRLIFEKFKMRLIMTLGIWGLADRNWERSPMWSDIKLIQWIKEKL